MDFRRIEPTGHTCEAIDYYWLAKDDNSTRVKQKINPDGIESNSCELSFAKKSL
jgi:hypothetical protein